jgi:putative Holliday junction resolvase
MATRFLGLDYGTKKVGIALSDEEGKLAFPCGVTPNTSALVEKIREICEKENIGTVIIGESRDFGGKPNPLMKKIIPFKKKLEYALGLPIFFEPEFLTSKQARNIQEGSALTDASAAAIILQSFLDKNNKL